MKIIILSVLLFFSGAVFAESYNGKITLEEGSSFDDRKPQIIQGGDLEYSVKFFVGEFVSQKAIFAYTVVKCNLRSEGKYTFSSAFLDAEGNLIAASAHTTVLKPGVETQLGGLYSEVPQDAWKKVTTYKFSVSRL